MSIEEWLNTWDANGRSPEDDPEASHSDADTILVEFMEEVIADWSCTDGIGRFLELYKDMTRWYS